MTEAIQRSFAGGELSPALYARADVVKYATGLRLCRNFQVQKHGGVANRAGTIFTVEIKDSTKTVALLDFQFDDEQTYILEFGEGYIRFTRDGGQLSVSGVSAWVTSTAYVASDLVSNGGVNYYCFLAHTSSASDEPGVGVDWQDYWHALTGSIYEVPNPYLESELLALHYVQSGDVVTIVHPSHPPMELSRFGETTWVFAEKLFEPAIVRPTDCAASKTTSGSTLYRYRVTAIEAETFQESLPGLEATVAITGATQADPVVITTGTHGYATDDEVYIADIFGMTELNGRLFTINVLTTTTYELVGEDGTGHTAYVSGGTSARTHCEIDNVGGGISEATPNTVTWTATTGAQEYLIYRDKNGVFGYIGTAVGTSFDDPGIVPDTSSSPPIFRNPFDSAGNYPSDVTYYQQRHLFANTNNDPETVFTSRTADYNNFSIRSPLQADDAVTWAIAGKKVNQVRNMIELDRLMVMTTGGEHLIEGDADGILRPGSINPKQQGHNGSALLPPIAISNVIIYLQARASIVRDLRIEKDKGYTGSDLTVFANHLFEKYTIVDWDYAQNPNSILWVVRNDGVLLGLTYLPEHEVWGWHHHDTDGFFERVRVVPEGNQDVPYFVVRRTINGVTKRYIERLHSRTITDIRTNAFFVDSGLTYDGRNTNTSHTMTLSGGVTWAYTEDLTLTSSAVYFQAADVGNDVILKLVDAEGTITDRLTCRITAFTSTTVVTVQANKDVPVGYQNVALSDWGLALDEFINLDHLEAKTVSALSDGNVERDLTVTSGIVTLQKPGEVVHIGLPIQSDIETLDIDTPEGEPLAGKRKLVNALTLQVESSRGIWAGPNADDLREFAQREFEDWGDPTELLTGKLHIAIQGEWNDSGRIFIRQDDPLPLTVLSIVPEGAISD